jgi:hypothetical protein
MSQLDGLLEDYCKCTNCSCVDCNCGNSQELRGLEAKVRTRLRAQSSRGLGSPILARTFPKGTFRPAVMVASLALGMASIGLTQPAYSANPGGMMVFSLNSPDLPSTLLGRSH